MRAELVYEEDFNTGEAGTLPDGWYVDNGVWEHGVPTVGPENCAGGDDDVEDDYCVGTVLDGNYPADTDSRLVSAPVTLPTPAAGEEVQLRFWHWFSYHAYYDYGQVEIQVWDGQSWGEWMPVAEPYGDDDSTVPTDSGVWSLAAVDLTEHAGETIRIGFMHFSHVDGFVSTGWYVDDVRIYPEAQGSNEPPELAAIGNESVDDGDLLTFVVTATDPDGDALVLTTSNLPGGAEFTHNGDGTGTFSWQTEERDAACYSDVLFKVTDDGVPPLSDSEAITICVGDVNRPPVLNPIGDRRVDEYDLVWIAVIASDPDGDLLVLDAPEESVFLDLGDGTGVFTWIAETEDDPVEITFRATDSGMPAESASELVSISVPDVCEPPDAPTNLKARLTRNYVLLRWTASDDADDYVIYRRVDGEDPFEEIGTTSGTTFRDRDFAMGADFDLLAYYVVAVNDCGESEPSDTIVLRPKGRN